MTEHNPSRPEDFAPPPPPKRRRWPHVVIPIVTGLVGILIGIAGQPEPEVRTQTETVTETETAEVPGEVPADELAALDQREADVQAREDAAAAVEAELADREAAVTETEETIAAGTVTEGIWTVGVDIEPGTYRATDVSADCYWAVLVTGTNGADIVDNDIPGGGNPTVNVEEGQDFETTRCGSWERQ